MAYGDKGLMEIMGNSLGKVYSDLGSLAKATQHCFAVSGLKPSDVLDQSTPAIQETDDAFAELAIAAWHPMEAATMKNAAAPDEHKITEPSIAKRTLTSMLARYC